MIALVAHGGRPATPTECLIFGGAFFLIGFAGVMAAVLPMEWARSIRGRAQWKGGGRMSRLSLLVFSTDFVMFGGFMANENFKLFRVESPLHYLGWGFVAIIGCVAIDAFSDWKRRGFPIRHVCPHCKAGLDFRVHSTKCPRCGQNL